MKIDITTDLSKAEATIRQAGLDVKAELAKIVLGAGQILAGEMRREVVARNTKDPTGQLAQSMRASLLVKKTDEVGVIAGSDLPYARVQNDGDPQHGINGAHLMAIPNRSVVPRGKSPRDYPKDDLVFIKGKSGAKLLIKPGKKGKFELHFVLKDSVNIPGTHYAEAAAAGAKDDIDDHIADSVEALLGKVRVPK